jgi:hypothetical protein
MGVESFLAPFMQQAEVCSMVSLPPDRSLGCHAASDAKELLTIAR